MLVSYMKQHAIRGLNTPHNTGLWLCLGAFCTTHIDSVQAAANEPLLGYRRVKLSRDYSLCVASNPTNPA